MTATIELLILGFVGDVIMTYAVNPLEDAVRKKMKQQQKEKEKEEKKL